MEIRKTINLFIDGSVNPQNKIGYGAYLSLDDNILYSEELKNKVIIKMFEDTSSTKLEIQTFLWSIKNINYSDCIINIHTDCKNLIDLTSRKDKLESSSYYTSKGKLLANHKLYKEFYLLMNKYKCKFIKVKGHKKNSLKNETDKIFNIVDKASREALRKNLNYIK